MTPRIIAIDWSGAVDGARKKIWLAEVADGELLRIENGRNRDEIAVHLAHEKRKSERLLIGLDFAFGLPAWYPHSRGVHTAEGLWKLAATEGEAWLAQCEPPFWGRPEKGIPELGDGCSRFRRTDLDVPPVGANRPKSVFQIGGAGAVGTGSVRGMQLLAKLKSESFGIWPFDAGWPRVIEIYPRALTGEVIKSDAGGREAYLENNYPQLADRLRDVAASNEDAFDAAVSALVMWANVEEIEKLEPLTDPEVQLEGWIWYPRDLGSYKLSLESRGGQKPPRPRLRNQGNDDDPMELARRLLKQIGPSRFKALLRTLLE